MSVKQDVSIQMCDQLSKSSCKHGKHGKEKVKARHVAQCIQLQHKTGVHCIQLFSNNLNICIFMTLKVRRVTNMSLCRDARGQHVFKCTHVAIAAESIMPAQDVSMSILKPSRTSCKILTLPSFVVSILALVSYTALYWYG